MSALCRLCDKSFTQMKNLKRYEGNARRKISTTCNDCSALFSRADTPLESKRSCKIKKVNELRISENLEFTTFEEALIKFERALGFDRSLFERLKSKRSCENKVDKQNNLDFQTFEHQNIEFGLENWNADDCPNILFNTSPCFTYTFPYSRIEIRGKIVKIQNV